jgi:hypothetical protein
LAIPSLLSVLVSFLHVRKRPRAKASPEGDLQGGIFGGGVGTKVPLCPVPAENGNPRRPRGIRKPKDIETLAIAVSAGARASNVHHAANNVVTR